MAIMVSWNPFEAFNFELFSQLKIINANIALNEYYISEHDEYLNGI